MQSEYLATFPAAAPGFVQLQTEELTGSLEVTLMFRTGQRRGMLAYLQERPAFNRDRAIIGSTVRTAY